MLSNRQRAASCVGGQAQQFNQAPQVTIIERSDLKQHVTIERRRYRCGCRVGSTVRERTDFGSAKEQYRTRVMLPEFIITRIKENRVHSSRVVTAV